MTFSQRIGLVEANTLLQRDSMSEELRISLWNVLDLEVWQSTDFMWRRDGNAGIFGFSKALWFHFFKKPLDKRPQEAGRILAEIRTYFFSAEWFRLYDFIEYSLLVLSENKYRNLRHRLNQVLERELAGYRVVEDKFVPITDQTEIAEITEAISESPFSGSRYHLKTALDLMSSREKPDYRNSIKESISAIESAAHELTGDKNATLGDALKVIEKSGDLHGALKAGFSALYGYTSDADGIRHGMIEVPNLTSADAKYFLVVCSAFVNYLVSKNAGST